MNGRTETWALKEWALALRALSTGDQILLLRKGGIVEETGDFEVASSRCLLYPTFYHQDAEILKPDYRSWIDGTPTEAPPVLELTSWAEVSDVVTLHDPEPLDDLTPFHIWTTEYIKDRFYWKPEKPLTLLLMRSYRLPSPVRITVQPEYGGCLSWVRLIDPVDLSGSQPVLSDETFQHARSGILDAVSSVAG